MFPGWTQIKKHGLITRNSAFVDGQLWAVLEAGGKTVAGAGVKQCRKLLARRRIQVADSVDNALWTVDSGDEG